MKPEELIIGAIIQVKGDCQQKPYTVGGVQKDEPMWLVYLVETKTWYDLRYIAPYPICDEILDMNGFNLIEHNQRLLKENGYEIWIESNKEKHWVCVKVNNDACEELPLHYYEGFISTVHELQRILALCFIDKKIIVKK